MTDPADVQWKTVSRGLWPHAANMTMTNTTAVKDLVCGMDVEPATAAGRSEYQGETYYFCGASCKEKFDLNPEQYVSQSAETPKSGGCCG